MVVRERSWSEREHLVIFALILGQIAKFVTPQGSEITQFSGELGLSSRIFLDGVMSARPPLPQPLPSSFFWVWCTTKHCHAFLRLTSVEVGDAVVVIEIEDKIKDVSSAWAHERLAFGALPQQNNLRGSRERRRCERRKFGDLEGYKSKNLPILPL